jgi:hypothetical protein
MSGGEDVIRSQGGVELWRNLLQGKYLRGVLERGSNLGSLLHVTRQKIPFLPDG